MSKFDPQSHRDTWTAAMQSDRPFYIDRPAAFSPAIPVQEPENRTNMLWRWAPIWLPWEYGDWITEARSFHDSAFLGDWSGLTKFRVSGPDALSFLNYVGTNDLMRGIEIGQVKHHIQTTPEGKVTAEGALYRMGPEEFRYTGGNSNWMKHVLDSGDWKADGEIESADVFVFEIQGPTSLAVMQEATGEDLRDIGFNRGRTTRIAGNEMWILRTGISGELGYEVHGPSEHAVETWEAIVAAGTEHQLILLGARSQIIAHTEAGIATNTLDYLSAALNTAGQSPVNNGFGVVGSHRSDDLSLFFRSPYELGWGSRVHLDSHDFIGRDALKAEHEAGGPARKLAGLLWNSADTLEIFAGLFNDEPSPTPPELPRIRTLEASKLLRGGDEVGFATSRIYSPYLRRMISLCQIDRALAEPGTEVEVVWGDPDGPQRIIRAEVVALPFKEDKRRIDVSTVDA